MGGPFIVTLREGFEAALILGIVYTYLHKIGAARHYAYVTRGAVLGVLASVGLGAAVSVLSGPLLDLGPDLIGLVVISTAVVVLTWHGYWMQRQARGIRGEVQQRIDAAEATRRLWVIGLIAFTGVFREGAETVLFLWGLMAQATSVSGWVSAAGATLGLATAAVIGLAIFRGGKHVSLLRFFGVTSVLLLLLAAGMFSTALGKLEALGVLPQSPELWNTSFALSDHSAVGGFLNGLVGYRARPSLFEAGGYAVYVIIAGVLLFGHGLSKTRPSSPTDRSAARVA